ncbi:acetyl-CoA carboxylase carboxyltransferase subunit alpha [Novosphingobium aerophilum]|uniref:acetyl-CoA carboxylase carboxyltransferase subunit alpha n=1 Tax=Novosphingobium TaxID=165696 RepID=UPI0006C88E2F|nr:MULTISPECIES: acetyl-CoA carboxylase carboxyltransferase subunit alpha [unclassified Novosphingobium]KPH62292.1 acetyl-CoA carboxylase subunit alpha [Novosphingobium sp. ST904]MPS67780.1 acetyl-CoA carboxylase carboxyltransferase subunit alpha [Novosphingobium sp.]TCM43375.1 acetyl-CoA carboxylase carboxyltransferase subunit alpha [Novosphingobium sp. ST904]WRT92977.1 acetyl-CoA carboxylase carboxyltransferase subunit alpha [Novosphingobium sp. RL4]
MISFLEFEKPIAALEARIAELRTTASDSDLDIAGEIARLEKKSAGMLAGTYAKLTPWQKTQVARHPQRPHFVDYLRLGFTDFIPLAGDRVYGEDEAIVGGLARLNGRKVMVLGHEKGHDTPSRIKHNFGSAKPEGYRKAIRLMEMAGKFGLPVVTLVDTAGAFPGVEAEERGQAEAIARSIEACLAVPVPIVSAIVGEGGSGGAVALAAADRVLMLEHSIYSVISPEGASSILWRTPDKAPDAAEAMKVTAQDLLSLGVIERIVPEPVGGAQRDAPAAARSLFSAIDEELDTLSALTARDLLARREERFLAIGRA